jgi:hypothetical protein
MIILLYFIGGNMLLIIRKYLKIYTIRTMIMK